MNLSRARVVLDEWRFELAVLRREADKFAAVAAEVKAAQAAGTFTVQEKRFRRACAVAKANKAQAMQRWGEFVLRNLDELVEALAWALEHAADANAEGRG